jgi:hypothetical protein
VHTASPSRDVFQQTAETNFDEVLHLINLVY